MNKYNLLLLATLLLFSQIGKAQTYQKTEYGVKTTINSVNVEIQFFNPGIVRIIKSPHGIMPEKRSLSVIKTPGKTQLTIHQEKNELSVTSKSVQLILNMKTGQISFFNPDGRLLLKEKENGIKFTPTKDLDENTFVVNQAFQLDNDEAIYGLGQHQKGTMNQRNQKITLKQNNMQICIPFFQSVKGYGLFWDNYSTTVFDDNSEGTSFESEVGDCADYYFMYGGNADGVIAAYRDLTGQAPMFPRWAFGYWQSRERYKSQDETIGVVEKYRELQVPLDGIVQDWQYWGVDNRLWNSTEFGNPLFPNPQGMIDRVHELNAHIIISVWPGFGNQTRIFDDMKRHGYLFNFTTWPITPDVQVYDPFNPDARDLYWSYVNKNIFSMGMDGWWLDSTEPDQMRPKEGDDDNKTYLGTFRKVRNAFPLVHTGGVYQHQRQITSDKRVFILARSAFAGQQRFGTTTWSGDVLSRWDVLRKQISGGLNLSLTGIPYWNSDIGGFFSARKYPKGAKDPAFQELYVRWLQFSTFCPMMRSHGTDTPREIYQFGEKGYWAYDAIEKFINLRYRLLPYIYSDAWSVTSEASTMMRALVMDFVTDKKVQDINNEYMFGKSILVCPVTDSLYTSRATGTAVVDFSTVKTQKVYLPEGSDWFDFWTGKKVNGGQEIQKEVPIDIIPIYVMAGSIVPMGPFVQYSSEKTDPVEIRIYPGADGEFKLYEDENDNYNYEKGIYSLIEFHWDDALKTLTINDRKGEFSGMLNNRKFEIVVVNENTGIGLNISKSPAKTINYSGKEIVVSLQ